MRALGTTAVLCITLFATACAKDKAATGSATAESRGASAATRPGAGGRAAGAPSDARVHFHFDSSILGPEAIKVLSAWSAYLAANPGAQVRLEGHCDEHGTPEYNIALGERRAIAARDYLVGRGVAESQISVVSYGEERPLVQGRGERAWRQNRRVEIREQR